MLASVETNPCGYKLLESVHYSMGLEREVYAQTARYSCVVCSLSFPTSRGLAAHMVSALRTFQFTGKPDENLSTDQVTSIHWREMWQDR